ncbi:MAG: DUF2378 family protein [Myxococcota bacterium]
MAEKLIFSQTIEGLLRSVSGRLTPELMAGMKARGIDPSAPLLPAYPVRVFIDVVSWLATELHPGRPLDDAVCQVGRAFMDSYGETMVGRAMLAMIRLIGPRRTLERVTRQFRTGNNFSDTRLTPRSATEYDLWVNEVSMVGWYLGLLSRGVELAGAKGVEVTLLSHDAAGAVFRVRWSG